MWIYRFKLYKSFILIIKKVKKIINLDFLYYCASIFNINENVRNSEKYQFIKGNLNNYELLTTDLKR